MKYSIPLTLLVIALLGCHNKPNNDGIREQELRSSKLSYVVASNGTKFTYFEYTIDTFSLRGDSESELAVFVYPIFSARSKGLALPHMPSQAVAELFGEELFGRQYSIAVNDGVLLIDNIPVSRPVNISTNSNWIMRYGDTNFNCTAKQKLDRDYLIKCDSNQIELNLKFNIDRGFTSYQDYCGNDLCTYNLKSNVGLLSPYHLRLLTE